MKFGRLATLTSVIILLSCQGIAHRQTDLLHVMLQGSSSSSELSTLVQEVGGEVTHNLHLINAVGAKLTRKQLSLALKSGLITFYIDDLATEGDPDAEEAKEESKVACRVRGQVELDIHNSGFTWSLYNKKPKPAQLEQLEIEWPPYLGHIASITFGGKPLKIQDDLNAEAQELKLRFSGDAQPVITDISDLEVVFDKAAKADKPPRQQEFSIDAKFVGGCAADSPPGYENNHDNYYYNTVAGVDGLHLQDITGKGVTVAVIDSGLWNHPALMRNRDGELRVRAFYNALTDKMETEISDDGGHGSHMTSIIANSFPTKIDNQPNGTFKGVAPDVEIVVVKALDREGRSHVLDIARAAQWVVDNRERYDIKVLNLSLAQRPRWPYWEDPVTQVVMRAWASGITVVAAASNEGPEPMSIGSPGNLPYIITVGAVTDSWTPDNRDDDYIPDFSSQGPTPSGHVKPDVVALGGHMTGLIPPDSDLALEQPEDLLKSGELTSTGTSQAAALVSGIAALMLQLEPDLTPDELKCKLLTSAEPAINADGKLSYSPFQQGYGFVSASRTVTLGDRECGTGGLDIAADIANQRHFYGPTLEDKDGEPTLPNLEKMVSREPSKKGQSVTRKWGVKAHIERLDPSNEETTGLNIPGFDWLELYLQEKESIENLSTNSEYPPL